MKKILLSFALAVGLLTSASTAMAQVNMSRYITLTVTNGAAIRLDFGAAAYGTSVRIVSGSNTQNITVGPVWYNGNSPSTYTVTAGASTMTVYGDLIGFNCSGNGANLTALDPLNNTELRVLSCHSNQLTTLDVSQNTQLTELECSYNQLTTLDVSHNTQLTLLSCSSNHIRSLDVSHNTQLTWLSCSYNGLSSLDVSNNTQLETLYCHGNNLSTLALDDIFCSLPDRRGKTNGWIKPVYSNSLSDNAIVLATNKANAINKNWKVQYYKDKTDIPATTGTYVCGSSSQLNMDSYITLTVANGQAIKLDFKAAAAGTPVRIVSGSNTQDITVGRGWYNNNIPSTYTVTAGASTMTVYGDIIGFDCSSNGANLTSLDPSHNTQLTELNCRNNSLNSLDISQNTQLEALYCHGNKFTTATLDDIFCALPDRTGKSYGWIQPVYNSSSSNHATVLATNAANATFKNWKVQYSDGNVNITTTGSYVCGSSSQPNMKSYITLTVKSGENIKLDFKAAAAGTPVRIVSGSNTQDITVGRGWYNNNIPSTYTVTAGASTMTVYGDIIGFDCSSNGANLTSLDPSHNTQLTELNCRNNSLNSLDISQNTQLEALYCHGNKFTTATLDDIFCALPDRTGKSYGWIQPVYNSSSSNHATVLATNAANATAKNWKVKYYKDNTDIPATTGTYVCGSSPQPNMDSYITLTVLNRTSLGFSFRADSLGTPVRIVSGSRRQDTIVGTDWIDVSLIAADSTVTVYGYLTEFSCSRNRMKITGIDVSNNTQLKTLYCTDNKITEILGLSKCTQLTELYCGSNRLTDLDVSKNTALKRLFCERNRLSSLDISNNAALMVLNCHNNSLNSLGISQNTQLEALYCSGNKFTTATLDDIYCALPDRTGNTNGKIQPIFSSSSPNHATVLATNKQNAIAKNWKVQYFDDDTDIPATTGKHKCSATDIAEASAEPALTLYPNPVADVLYLSATARTVRVYNIYGIEVAHAYDTDKVEVSHLPAGVYTVRADGTVAKMVKR